MPASRVSREADLRFRKKLRQRFYDRLNREQLFHELADMLEMKRVRAVTLRFGGTGMAFHE